eukprot:RCo006651
MFVTSTSSSGASALQVLQQQKAQRTADQAEQEARVLQQKARAAQNEADQAQDNASSLKTRSEQADGKAGQARLSLESLRSLQGTQKQMQDLRAGIAEGLKQLSPSSASGAAVLNAEGQSTGSVINVTA